MTETLQRTAQSRLVKGIGRVDLRVRDIDRAVGFYRDVVGLEVSQMGGTRAELRSPEGPAFLVLDAAGVSEPADPHATGLFHTAFRFPTRAALGDALRRVVDARLELGAGDHLVSEALYVDDPDGNGVELYWDRPVEQWPVSTESALVPMWGSASAAMSLWSTTPMGSSCASHSMTRSIEDRRHYEGGKAMTHHRHGSILSSENDAKRSELIELLTRAYWMEIEAVMSYIASSTNPDGVRAQEIVENLRQDIQEELGHAQQLAQRIKELYGAVPGSMAFKAEQSYLQPPEDPTDITAVIRGVIEAERAAIDHYNRVIGVSDGVDYVTQDMVIQILKDEEGHLRLFEGFLKEYERAS
jgi:bacterioferritin